MPQETLIAIGSNVANATIPPISLIKSALAALKDDLASDLSAARLFTTPAFPAGSGPDFVNTAVRFKTTRPLSEILANLHDIEARFGRERDKRWGARTLDLDLIACGDVILPDAPVQARWRMLHPDRQIQETPDQLILPHPRMQDRAFVLVPLMDIAPDWVHPTIGLTVAQMCARLPADDVASVRVIEQDISA